MVLSAVLAALAAYLLGATPTGFLVARAFGVRDVRRHGSGNIGATNVLRAAGRKAAIVTLLGDVVKGYLAVTVGTALSDQIWAPALCALTAVVGNCWSIFLGFRGGKGVATGLGAMLRLVPLAVLPAVLVWGVITLSFRYVSLSSILAAICVPLGTAVLGYPLSSTLATAAVGLIVVIRHRENISRLVSGTERRLGERVEAA